MRRARLRNLLSIRARTGDPPSWPEIATAWGAIEPPKQAREVQQTGLLAPYVDTIIVDADERLQAGQLIVWGSLWWRAENIAHQETRGRYYVISARPFVGRAATYDPAAGGAYPVTAWIGHSSSWVGFDAIQHDRRQRIELLLPELDWPWGQTGDAITLDGRAWAVDGIERGGETGEVLTVRVR